MKRRNLLFAGIASTVVLGASTAGVAFATPGSGASATTLGTGLAEEKVRTRGNLPYDVVAQSIVIQPGGHTGWHTHPGIAVAIVKTGSLTIYDADDKACVGQTYVAGQVYVDPGYGHAHIAFGDAGTTTEVLVTYLDVPVGGSVRIDAAANPDCPF